MNCNKAYKIRQENLVLTLVDDIKDFLCLIILKDLIDIEIKKDICRRSIITIENNVKNNNRCIVVYS